MDTKLLIGPLVVMMALACSAELTEDDIPTCVDQMSAAFKDYVVPDSVRLYAESIRQLIYYTDDDSALYRTPLNRECQEHLLRFSEISSSIPCHKELSESIDYYDEYDEAVRKRSPHLYRIIKGARSCI